MRVVHVPLLACPGCHAALALSSDTSGETVDSGTLSCASCGRTYPIVGGIARFVPRDNYASSFGLQWRQHARTQYDSTTGVPISATRLFAETEWPQRMDGELILEAGSGSGRFTEVLAGTGATIVSFDYSRAVEANYAAHAHLPNVLIVQGDVYRMPFRLGVFDRACCLGVLQHTPDVERAFHALPPMVKPGGHLAVDVYRKPHGIRRLLNTKYWVRPLTRRIPPERLYPLVERYVRGIWPLARRLPKRVNWVLLVADYRGEYDLPAQSLREWAVLDSFDMLSPTFDSPQDIETVRRWISDAGLERAVVRYGHNGIEARGYVPSGGDRANTAGFQAFP
jgi:SAM-dependent methyltransferase